MHAELGRLGHDRRRLHRLLELVDDLALDGLELGQPLHGPEVVEGDAEVGGQSGGRRLVERSENLRVGVDQQQDAVKVAVASDHRHGQARCVRRQFQALQEAPVTTVQGQVACPEDPPAGGVGPHQPGQRRPGEAVDLAGRHTGGGHHVDPVAQPQEGHERSLGEGAGLLGDPFEFGGDLARAVDCPGSSSEHLHMGAHRRPG